MSQYQNDMNNKSGLSNVNDGNKKLCDFIPNQLLLNNSDLENVSNKYGEIKELGIRHRQNVEIIITLIVNLLLNGVALSLSQLDTWKIVFNLVILGILLIYLIVMIVKAIENRSKLKKSKDYNRSLGSLLIEKSVEKSTIDLKYTAILRIVQVEGGEVRYLLSDKDYFLPHCTMDKNKGISEQTEIITYYLSHFKIRRDEIVNISAVDNDLHFSIKPIQGKLYINAYAFYDITIKEQAKSKIINELNISGFRWATRGEMINNPLAVSTNDDVIKLLNDLPKPHNSFVNIFGNIKLIWNITSQCPYKCDICSTADEKRRELDVNGKLQVLNSIYTAKSRIKSIDFSGGDPLYIDAQTKNSSKNIINAAISMFGDDKISVTATGVGIAANVNSSEFERLIKNCEITIDAAHKSNPKNELSRNQTSYCSTNLDTLNTVLAYAESLMINVPIIHCDLTDDEISQIVENIENVKRQHPNVNIAVTLIRLMPVGKMREHADKADYNKYNPVPVANKIKGLLDKSELDIKCKLHCSLRALPAFCDECAHCNMLENKLGIDCAGNVFACAWGGYVANENEVEKNPYYLGNLTQMNLIDIINGNSKTEQYTTIMGMLKDGVQRKFCSVVSYYTAGKINENHDPLFDKMI